MAVAIVTGASSGIGLEICSMLLSQSYIVYGIARTFHNCNITNNHFVKTICDLSDLKSVEITAKQITEKENRIDLLVNNAGIGCFGPHETLKIKEIAEMVSINLLAPMVLSKLLIKPLAETKGVIVNISSSAALNTHKMGCAYAATKAGLLHFGECLFEEVRKSGIKICTICPDITSGTRFYDKSFFSYDESLHCHIEPSCISNAISSVLQQREGSVQTMIVIKPQKISISRKNKPI